MINGYYGLTYWFSIINKYSQEIVNQYNQSSLNWHSYGFYSDNVMNTLCGVKYYFSSNTLDNTIGYKLIEKIQFNNHKWFVYQNENFQSIAFVLSDKRQTKFTINNPSNRSSLITSKNEVTGKIDSIDYSGNIFEINTTGSTGEKSLLLVPYHENWSAYVNSKKVAPKMGPMNYMWVALDNGKNNVRFVYSNPFIKLGLISSITAMIICILLHIYFKRIL